VNAALDGKLPGTSAAPPRQEEFRLDGPSAGGPAQPAAGGGNQSTPLELVRRGFRDAVEIPRASVEDLNRGLPPALRYQSEAQAWRELWSAATAVGRFAVACGLVTAAELEALEAEFSELRPG
jgi:hypothetical protein